jgi:membrane-associated protein
MGNTYVSLCLFLTLPSCVITEFMEHVLGFDLPSLIRSVGYIGLFGIVFAESGLLLGFFLPGDSLLFTAGFLASQGYFDIAVLVLLCFVAAVLGDNFGYAFGKRVGPRIFRREDSLLFNKHNLEHARVFYEKHGGKTIILARFMPMIRTFAPILAGVGKMKYATFFFYNLAGGVLWAIGMPLAGFYLGSIIPDVDRYIIPIVLVIIILSVLPAFYHVLKEPAVRERFLRFLRRN